MLASNIRIPGFIARRWFTIQLLSLIGLYLLLQQGQQTNIVTALFYSVSLLTLMAVYIAHGLITSWHVQYSPFHNVIYRAAVVHGIVAVIGGILILHSVLPNIGNGVRYWGTVGAAAIAAATVVAALGAGYVGLVFELLAHRSLKHRGLILILIKKDEKK